MEEEIYAGEAGGGGCWKVRQWEGELIPKPENCGARYFWNFLSPFPFIHQPWPRKYTSICDKNSLTKPVQTSNNSPNHFRLSAWGSTQDSGSPGLESPWGTGPGLAKPRLPLRVWSESHLTHFSWREVECVSPGFMLGITAHQIWIWKLTLLSWSPSTSISSVQFSHSVVSDSLRPMDCSMPGLPVHHQLPEFTQTHVHWVRDAIQPSHPLLSPSPAPNPSHHQSLFQWASSLHQMAIAGNHWPHLRLLFCGPKRMTGYLFSLTTFGNVFSSWCLGAAEMPSKTLTHPDTGCPRVCLSGSLEHGQTVLVPWRGLLPTLAPFLSDLLPRTEPRFCRGHRGRIWVARQPPPSPSAVLSSSRNRSLNLGWSLTLALEHAV